MCNVPLDTSTHVNKDDMNKKYNCKNDEARSMIICHAKKGTKITVYDDGYLNANNNDDWTTITVKKDMTHDCSMIDTFQKDVSNSFFNVDYKTNGNLDGKISSFSISFGNGSVKLSL